MNIRLSPWVLSAFVIAAVMLMPSRSWAVFYPMGPSSDDWGMKYDLKVTPVSGEKLNVAFTLADGGRLKPINSITLIVFSKPHADGGRSYLVKAPIDLKPTSDGKLAGEVQLPKQYADIAILRVLTLTVDGRKRTGGAAYYDIPLKKFLNEQTETAAATTPAPVAKPPVLKVVK